jgi:hypothetical protein
VFKSQQAYVFSSAIAERLFLDLRETFSDNQNVGYTNSESGLESSSFTPLWEPQFSQKLSVTEGSAYIVVSSRYEAGWRFAVYPGRKYRSIYIHYWGCNYVCKRGAVFGKWKCACSYSPFRFAYSWWSHNISSITINVILLPIQFSISIVIAARSAEFCKSINAGWTPGALFQAGSSSLSHYHIHKQTPTWTTRLPKPSAAAYISNSET